MQFKSKRPGKQKFWRRQGVGMLCCLLGLVWIGIPNFHSFCHLVDLPHQHPTGSVFRHSHGHHSHSDNHGHSHSHGHAHSHNHGQSQEFAIGSLVDDSESAQRAAESDPEQPNREPGDSDAPLLCTHLLETEAYCSTPCEVVLDLALPALDEPNFERTSFFSSAELGTIGARGPPICMATC